MMLQWGRVLMNAEMIVNQTPVSTKPGASMGPRSYERGNNRPQQWCYKCHLLQWGRVLMNAEIIFIRQSSRRAACFNGAAFL